MPDPLYALTHRTAQRVQQLVADGGSTAVAPASGAAARGTTWVKVTGPAVSGWYPAVASLDQAGTFADLTGVVQVSAADGSAMTADRRYLCARTGDAADGTPRFRWEGRYVPPLGWSFASAPGVDAIADAIPVNLVSITIPEAGTYLLCARVQATINATISPTSGSTAIMVADIFGVDGTVYQTFLCPAVCSAGPGDSGYSVYGSGVIVGVASFVGPTTVTLRGWRSVAGIGLTWNTSRFTTFDNSDNTIQYLKLTGIDLAPGGFTGTVP